MERCRDCREAKRGKYKHLKLFGQNFIMDMSHQFREECGKPVSEVSGLTLAYPGNTLRLV